MTHAAARRAAVLAAFAALTACSGDKGTGPAVPSSVAVSSALVFWAPGETQTLTATVKDQSGKPIANATVTWSIDDTSIATISPSGVVTSKNFGNTSAVAHVGSLNGSTPITMQHSPYFIDLRFLTATTPARAAAFDSAAAIWSSIIVGDVSDFSMTGPDTAPAGSCGSNSPKVNEVVDDVIIFVSLDAIDGPGKILGQAGPCFIRNTSKFPILGLMHFDTADIATLESNGQFQSVILHEMGHVLGFGTVWDTTAFGLGLLHGAKAAGGTDPYFTGAHARAHFDSIGGTSYSGGQKVPVENTGSIGTYDSHWRESVFGNELMTGFLNGGVANPLSRLSVASMQDEGYSVNFLAAQPYTHTFSAAPLFSGPALMLENDIAPGPIYVVAPTRGIVGVLKK
jgi:leishmanolysin/Big-like domain-containing protein